MFASGLMLLILPCPMKVWALVAWPDTVRILSIPGMLPVAAYAGSVAAAEHARMRVR